MPLHTVSAVDALSQLEQFDAIVDARSPGEFALDHLPGAQNWPSLNDEERVHVGTMYKQVNAFEAKKVGAAMVAKNAAHHIEQHLIHAPKSWHPLVYCWRGGNRSHAQATIWSAIGFKVALLEGGYKAFRAAVVADIPQQVQRLNWFVVAGATGVGKTHILHALRDQGHQILDLEGLANHRSSVLGLLPGEQQPTQKQFETRLWDALRKLRSDAPVFIESESKRVGNVTVPESLILAIRASACVHIEMDRPLRAALLLRDYAHFANDTLLFANRLDTLTSHLGHATINEWKRLLQTGQVADVVHALLEQHYDPKYFESMRRNFTHYAQAAQVHVHGIDDADMADAAQQVIGLAAHPV